MLPLLALLIVVPWLWGRVFIGALTVYLFYMAPGRCSRATEVVQNCSSSMGPRLVSFRHALLNDLQLVYGYVQLGRSPEHTLSMVDRAIARIRQMGRIFGVSEWELSYVLFDMWEESLELDMLLRVNISGSFSGFTTRWLEWREGLSLVWTYYKELAQRTESPEIVLELQDTDSCWRVSLAVPEVIAAPGIPESLSADLGHAVKVFWKSEEHSFTMQVDKSR